MEGQGVVNYNVSRASFAISTETTEFDDELIRRGIITFEESMMRKGASHQEAMRLKEMKEGRTIVHSPDTGTQTEDAFLEQYRQKRLLELKQHASGGGGNPYGKFGQVMLISRQDWAREVNEASQSTWVVISLSSSDVERTGCMENAVAALSSSFVDVKFVAIPHQQAIANWPEEHLPTIFLYRHGKLQHQLVSLPTSISAEQLEWKLAQLGVLETDMEEEPSGQNRTDRFKTGSYSGTVFGGTGSELKTRELVADAMNAYDDVD